MKLLLKSLLILSVLVFSSDLSVLAQTPQEIVNQCITSLGGEKGVKNFSNYKGVGELDFFFGTRSFKGDVTLIEKGKKLLMKGEFDFGGTKMKMARGFDGKKSWIERMGNISEHPPLNDQSDHDHTPLLLLEKEATFSLGEKTEIEGKKAIGIEVKFNDKKTTFFIDQIDHTIKEIRYSDLFYGRSLNKETLEKRIRFLDYKKIEGAMFPMRMVFYQKSKKQMELHFQEIQFDPQVTADMFERPDQELDLRTREEMYH
jgi:hypothetical protein